jgi:hypothetical protein
LVGYVKSFIHTLKVYQVLKFKLINEIIMEKTFKNEMEKMCIVIEDGKIIRDFECTVEWMWYGLFSAVTKNGEIINYLKNLNVPNTILIIPRTDGNINRKPFRNPY